MLWTSIPFISTGFPSCGAERTLASLKDVRESGMGEEEEIKRLLKDWSEVIGRSLSRLTRRELADQITFESDI